MDSIKTFKYKFDSTSTSYHIHLLSSAKRYDDVMHDYNIKWYENKDLEARYDSAMKAVKRIERRKAKIEAGEFWGMAGYSLLATIIVGILSSH